MKKQRVFALLLTGVMALGLLAGCGNSTGNGGAPSGDVDDSGVTTDNITLTYWHYEDETTINLMAEAFMKKYPNAKVVVSGYADKGTGNAKINARLAAQRADVVVNCLKENFGIAEDRITYDSYGDTVQPFAENDLNRVSICIANPE